MSATTGSRIRCAARRVARQPAPLVALFGFRVVSAIAIALPVSTVLGAAVVGYPEGDAVLFEPGGELLVETVRLHHAALGAALGISFRWAIVLGLVGLVPLAMLLEAWRTQARLPWFLLVGRGLRRWPRFVAIFGLTVLAQSIAIALGVAFWPLGRSLGEAQGEVAADLVGCVPLALAALGVVACAIAADFARIGVVIGRGPGWASASRALEIGSRSPLRAASVWLACRAASLVVVLGGATLAILIDVHRPESWRLAAVAAVHLAVVGADVMLRAFFLAWATELVEDDLTPCRRSPRPAALRRHD